jgi:hypothetical protein
MDFNMQSYGIRELREKLAFFLNMAYPLLSRGKGLSAEKAKSSHLTFNSPGVK